MKILAPLRGVTIRCFRETFAKEIGEAGFSEAVTPFITATTGFDPLKDRELRAMSGSHSPEMRGLRITPQFIGKDPEALRFCLLRVREAGFGSADLNCGCPFPMVRNKGRGSGLLRTPDALQRMLDVGCDVMGPGNFSVKARLGVDSPGELLGLIPIINRYPLRFLTVHARTARQMYGGACDWEAFRRVAEAASVPVVRNGDLPPDSDGDVMVGRGFVRAIGERPNASELIGRYLEASSRELCGDAPVLGRMKELLSYWRDIPAWRNRWSVAKLARNLDEFRLCVG